MEAQIEIEAEQAAIEMLTDEFSVVEKSDEQIVIEEDMADIIEVVQLQGIPTKAWVVRPINND